MEREGVTWGQKLRNKKKTASKKEKRQMDVKEKIHGVGT